MPCTSTAPTVARTTCTARPPEAAYTAPDRPRSSRRAPALQRSTSAYLREPRGPYSSQRLNRCDGHPCGPASITSSRPPRRRAPSSLASRPIGAPSSSTDARTPRRASRSSPRRRVHGIGHRRDPRGARPSTIPTIGCPSSIGAPSRGRAPPAVVMEAIGPAELPPSGCAAGLRLACMAEDLVEEVRSELARETLHAADRAFADRVRLHIPPPSPRPASTRHECERRIPGSRR